jgi:hypothetical protein
LLTRDVKREVVTVDYALDKVKVLGHEFFEVFGDENASDVEFQGGL